MNTWLSDQEIWLSLLCWTAIVAIVFGLLLCFRKRTRAKGMKLAAVGCFAVALSWLAPPSYKEVTSPVTGLDAFAPKFQFEETHQRLIAAPQEKVYRAIKEVTAGEIRMFGFLAWVRRLGSSGREGILQVGETQPVLDVALRTSFALLKESEGRELVVGSYVIAPQRKPTPSAEEYQKQEDAGYVKGTMNFLLAESNGGGVLLSTGTRVYATDPASLKRFQAYWRVIYPGSSLIRYFWLKAIEERALRM